MPRLDSTRSTKQQPAESKPEPVSPFKKKGLTETELSQICIREVGERLTYLRTRHNLTLGEAESVTGISRSELSRLEKGERRMSEIHLNKLAAAYSLPLSEFREILSYQVKARTKILTLAETRPSPFETHLVNCFFTSALLEGRGLQAPRQITLPKAINLSTKGYAVEIDHDANDPFLPPNSLILIDPECRVRLGDLVFNNLSWDPIMLKLDRAANDRLIGWFANKSFELPDDAELSDFHKIVLLMPGAGVFRGLPLHQEQG